MKQEAKMDQNNKRKILVSKLDGKKNESLKSHD